MVKSTLILINFIGLALLNFFFLQRIEVAHMPPETLAPGQSAEVEVTITKGTVSGFAKFQLNVDAGMTIENIESSGASFTFNDQKAKFIWMSLPEDKKITLRYRLIAATNATGVKKIEGHFSYIDDNQRLVYDIATRHVSTSDAPDAVATTAPQTNGKAQAVVSREIIPMENGRYRVNLNIEKKHISGFAKVQDVISNDYTAIAIESAEAVFNIVDNKVKFVWFDIPSNENILIAYELIPVTDDAEEIEITGEFSYLVNGETRTTKIGFEEELLAETPDEDVSEPDTTEPEEVTPPEPEPEPEAPVEIVEVEEVTPWDTGELKDEEQKDTAELEERKEEKTETPQPAPEPEPEPEVVQETKETPKAVVPEPEADTSDLLASDGIYYRIQISAAHKVVDAKYFEERHKFTGPFFVEHHQGWIKYTTGKFDVYRAARDQRDHLRNGQHKFPGPFVTAYNEHERITVQEALMISNQKWVP